MTFACFYTHKQNIQSPFLPHVSCTPKKYTLYCFYQTILGQKTLYLTAMAQDMDNCMFE